MTTTQHLTKCKACKRELVVSSDDECPVEWVAKILPMACCNRCYDLKTEKDKAVSIIAGACVTLFQASKKSDELMTRTRDTLTIGTKLYSRFLAQLYNSKVQVWDVEFVNILIEQPGRWQKIVSDYRREFKRSYAA